MGRKQKNGLGDLVCSLGGIIIMCMGIALMFFISSALETSPLVGKYNGLIGAVSAVIFMTVSFISYGIRANQQGNNAKSSENEEGE